MKFTVYLVMILLASSGLLPAFASASPTESSVTVSFSGVVQQPPIGNPDAIISIAGSTIKVVNSGGVQLYSGTSMPAAFTNAIASTTNPTVLIQAGAYTTPSRVIGQGVNNVTVVFEEGAKIVLGNNVNQPVMLITGVSGWTILNPEIDGNAANQSPSYQSYGIWISSSTNCIVDEAYIHDVRVFGYYCQYNCVNCGIVNSLITNCGWNGITFGSGDAIGASHGNYALNNEVAYCSDVGITTYHVNSVIKNNYVHDITANTGFGGVGTHWGIAVEGGNTNTITENNITDCPVGIKVCPDGTSKGTANSNTIAFNTITHSLTVGIEIMSSYNEISNNQIINWDYASTWKNAITLEVYTAMGNSISDNRIIGNTLRSTYSTACGVGVRTSVTNTLIQGNDFTQVLGTKIIDAGIGTQIYDNVGYP